MLMPKRVKFRKAHRLRVRGNATRGNYVSFGEFGLMALQQGWISARQIEAARVAGTHFLGVAGRIHLRTFPHKPISGKPAETRMGKGKGEPEHYVAVVRPGQIIFEVAGVPMDLAKSALNLMAHKMPIRVKMVERRAQ